MDGDILRYSPDGVSVVDNSMNTIWNETYTMQNPIADVNGSRAVVADSEGTSLYICDKKRCDRNCNNVLFYCKSADRIEWNGCSDPGQ